MSGLRVYSKQKIDFLREKRGLGELETAEQLGITKMISGTIGVNRDPRGPGRRHRTGLLEDSERVEGSQDQLVELQNHAAVNMVRALSVRSVPMRQRRSWRRLPTRRSIVTGC